MTALRSSTFIERIAIDFTVLHSRLRTSKGRRAPLVFLFLAIAVFFCYLPVGYAANVTLQWDRNTEGDLIGYKVYYKQGASGAPYNGTDAAQGPSPITVREEDLADLNNPELTLTQLDDACHIFVVTAFDTE